MFIFSCTAKKAATTKPLNTSTNVSNTTFFEKIKKPSDFQQVKINSKINVETGNFVPTLDATIYVENGQKIWMNLVAVIVNIARGTATNEGIKGYEKWNKTYIDSDFTYLNNLLNVNFIDYNALQNLILGKTFIPVKENEFTQAQNSQGYS